MYNEYFAQVWLELNEEIQAHNTLRINLLQLPKDSPFELKFAEIAAFCGIILDGVYNNEELEEIAEDCLQRLRKARVELIEDISKPIPPTIN